ncbi:hypothetical protein D9M73_89380 [compost metagenome]
MPGFATLPLSQCHQMRGRALSGGDWKPAASGSAVCAGAGVEAGAGASRSAAPAMIGIPSIVPASIKWRAVRANV